MSFLLAMAETMWAWSVFMPLPLTPPTRGKHWFKPKYCLVGWSERKDVWVERQRNHHQKQQLISSRSCSKPQPTKKQTFSLYHPEQGTEQVLVFENCFRKTKIIVEKSLIVRQRRNKKSTTDSNLWTRCLLSPNLEDRHASAHVVLLIQTEKFICRNNCRALCVSSIRVWNNTPRYLHTG